MSGALYVVRGAVDPLLGYLSSAINDEAQLLGRLHRDAQFIKDEMESMNGFLHHLSEAGDERERDHQVRAWMKQVRDLAYDTQYCIDLYGHRVGSAPTATGSGVWGHARRAVFFLRTIPARHEVATQIWELKSRARDAGERRLRYGVKVPAKHQQSNEVAGGEEAHAYRRDLDSVELEPDILKDGTVQLIDWLKKGAELHQHVEEPVATAATTDGRPVVIAVVAPDKAHGGDLAKQVYQHLWVARQFHCKAWITIQRPLSPRQHILQDMIDQLSAPAHQQGGATSDHQQLPPAPAPAPAPAHQQGGLSHDQQLEDKKNQQVQASFLQWGRGSLPVFRKKKNQDQELEDKKNQQVKEELQKCVEGRRFLIVVENADHPSPWNEMKEILDSSGCSPGSAIMVTTKDGGLAERFSPNRTKVHSFFPFCFERAKRQVSIEFREEKMVIIRRVLEKCDPDPFCMKLLLCTLRADPYTSKGQLEDLCTSLDSSSSRQQPDPDGSKQHLHIQMKMMKFCYDKLTKTDRSCLLYLSIFPPNSYIRRNSLVRRWVAEGHVTKGDGQEAIDRAERCFDDLVAQGFVDIAKAGNLGHVIYCRVQHIVCDFITKIVRDENFGDASLPPKLACHVSISSDIQWHQVLHKQQQKKQQQQQGSGSGICNCFSPVEPQGEPDDITIFLESLPAFSRMAARVKVMDLDKCKHLKNRHLKRICNNMFMLKYLSIRSTEISRLPRELNELKKLETLDIRQTKVPSSSTKGLFLPMLIHLLAGPVVYQAGVSTDEPLFSTVRMPSEMGRMIEMETLIHVEVVEDDKELKCIKNLKRLKTLGVVIHGKQDNVNHLLRVVTELSEHLRKLSVWVTSNGRDIELTQSLPKLLESLSINGITKGLPNWIQELPHLVEITLRKTMLSHDSMRFLGELVQLRCLTLRHESCIENSLSFEANEFNKIQFLVIEGASNIKRIKFYVGTAPKLEKIVWTFTSMDISQDTITGLNNLPSLKELELNGDFDPYHVEQAVALHPNCPIFRPKDKLPRSTVQC